MPIVSVIMPVYNQEQLVGSAIRSILNQSFEDYEFIIVDDGSTDDTVRVIERFDDPRISLIKAEHGGFIEALKIGTSHASGKWIARMDSDDISARTRLERQVAFLDEHPECKFVTTIYGIVTPRNKVLIPNGPNGEWRYISAGDITLNTVPFCDPGTMFDREAAAKKGYDAEFESEKTLWYELLREGKGALMHEVMYFIRWRIGSVSRGQYLRAADFGYQMRRKYDPTNAGDAPVLRPATGPSATEKKTVYYYGTAGDFSTARETAIRLWRRYPFDPQSLKLVLYSLGFGISNEIEGPAGIRMSPVSFSDSGISLA